MRRLLTGILIASSIGSPLRIAAQPGASTQAPAPTTPGRVNDARVLPGTKSNAFTSIRGSALDANNAPLANSTVRLRDLRSGRVVNTTAADTGGAFTFNAVDPGSYIAEVMAPDQVTVLAASNVLNVNAGDNVTAFVKLPFKTPPFAGAFGRTATTAAIVVGVAAASGVLATQIAGEQKSPRQ